MQQPDQPIESENAIHVQKIITFPQEDTRIVYFVLSIDAINFTINPPRREEAHRSATGKNTILQRSIALFYLVSRNRLRLMHT